jgi:hypothetical protein
MGRPADVLHPICSFSPGIPKAGVFMKSTLPDFSKVPTADVELSLE